MCLILSVFAIIPILAADAQTGKIAEAPIPTFTVCEILAQRDALAAHLEIMREVGDPIPAPSSSVDSVEVVA